MYDTKKKIDPRLDNMNNTMPQPFYLSFNDHPIVSTVLWMLGHDMSKDQKRKDRCVCVLVCVYMGVCVYLEV